MDTLKLMARAERFARRALAGEGTGHDWWHIARVRESARRIHAEEGGDLLVIELAVLLHDVGDRKVIQAPEDDYTIAAGFLERARVPRELRDHVLHIVQNLSFSRSLDEPDIEKTLEFCIVQDADRLDALGAIGIARAFAFGGSRGRLLYDPTVAPRSFQGKAEYHKHTGGSLNHFEEKLFRLEALMNTKAGKKLARQRTHYMRAFVLEFMEEWEGKR